MWRKRLRHTLRHARRTQATTHSRTPHNTLTHAHARTKEQPCQPPSSSGSRLQRLCSARKRDQLHAANKKKIGQWCSVCLRRGRGSCFVGEREGECAAAGSSPPAMAGGAAVPRPDLWSDSASHVNGPVAATVAASRAAMHGGH
jgi:hypothetical protein